MAEIAKQQEDKLPEFAIKTQLLTRKAEEKERLDKAKEQMHFQQLLRSKSEESEDESNETTKKTTGILRTKSFFLQDLFTLLTTTSFRFPLGSLNSSCSKSV